jgi:hypothetical protein
VMWKEGEAGNYPKTISSLANGCLKIQF